MLIYSINRKSDNKVVYIGQTTRSLEIRKLQHFNTFERLKAKSINEYTCLYRAFRKYGIDNFSFSLIKDNIGSQLELDLQEQYYISLYSTYPPRKFAYNMTSGGQGQKEYSQEYLRKLSESQIRRYTNQYERVKTGEKSREMYIRDPSLIDKKRIASLKRYQDPNERKKTSLSTKKAFDLDPSIKERIGKATRQRYIDHPELREKQRIESMERFKLGPNKVKRQVVCTDTGEIFPSIKSAADSVGVKPPAIIKSISKGSKCKNFFWKYYNQDQLNQS